MQKLITISVLALLTGSLIAEVGDLTPVSVPVQRTTFSRPLMTQEFTKRSEGDGTVNEHAIIGSFRRPDGSMLKVAVDAAGAASDRPDVIRFDFSGEGDFQMAPLLRISNPHFGSNMTYLRFGPATLTARLDGRDVPISVMGYYRRSGSSRYMYVFLTTALEGSCRFGDVVRRVRLVDLNNNLRCDDETQRGGRQALVLGDTVLVADENGRFPPDGLGAMYGQRLQVAGTWFDLKLSADDSRVTATAAEVRTGRIHIPHERWSALLLGRDHLLRVSGTAEPMVVPADTYALVDYQQFAPAHGKATLMCAGREALTGQGKRFEVRPGEVAEAMVGSPMTAALTVHKQGRSQVRFSLELKDAAGASVTNLLNAQGQRPAPPVLEVRDTSSEVVYTGKMEYG